MDFLGTTLARNIIFASCIGLIIIIWVICYKLQKKEDKREDKNLDEFRTYKDINEYRELLIGKKISSIVFAKDADEGLVVTCEDGTKLEFGFSACEGSIRITK